MMQDLYDKNSFSAGIDQSKYEPGINDPEVRSSVDGIIKSMKQFIELRLGVSFIVFGR